MLAGDAVDIFTPLKSFAGRRKLQIESLESRRLLTTTDGFEFAYNVLPWSSHGDQNWSITPDITHGGRTGAMSGVVDDNQSSILEISQSTDAGTVSFWRKVSSESFDILIFSIDGIEYAEWGGEQDWQQFSYSVDAGVHTFTWEYFKDDSLAQGSDAAWLDDVVFPSQQDLPPWITGDAVWAGSHELYVQGDATIVADPAGDVPIIYAAGPAASLTIDPTTDRRIHVAQMALFSGATATLASMGAARTASDHRVLVVNDESISIDADCKLDLTDNDLIVNYSGAGNASGMEALVRLGFGPNGDWLGNGITSSVAAAPSSNGNYALAIADNKNLTNPFGSDAPGGLNPKFDGENIDQTAVLIKFTNRVDLDLNGLVDANDAAIFNGAFSEGDAGATWMAGDVDLDGVYGSNDAAIFNSFYDESLAQL